jgi:oxygen-independent coproporphyrinogen III oxidase
MAGIYLHIPYCKQACHYCNFHFSTSLKGKNDFVNALLKEISLQQEYLEGESVETIYFGGGTPSLLTIDELRRILDEIYGRFQIAGDAELSLEANPDDIYPLTIKEWKKAGISRLSIGVQSFFEEDLRWMNRAHHANQAVDSIQSAMGEGLGLSIDLIYGTPTLSDEHWKKNIEQAVSYKIPHLSCYALTVEPRTPLSKWIREKKMAPMDNDAQARQFQSLMKWLRAAGYEHYEISNFALPGKRSLHNSAYWQGKKYLGLGPSAHSYNGSSRQWNVSSNLKYILGLSKNTILFEKEELTPVQILNEYIMISLRTIDGLDLDHVAGKFGANASRSLQKLSGEYIRDQKMENSGARLVLTEKGKLFADGIAAQLFFENLEAANYSF